VHLPLGDDNALKAAIDDETAAILVEPIQGEGGIREVAMHDLNRYRELCDEHGILLVFDEIQTGVARTGRLFAHQWSDIEPDIMAIAKGIGAGFPVGACLATEDAASGMVLGTHGSTFGGNPLAMAVGNAVLDVVLEDGFMDSVNEKARSFRQILAEMVDTFPDLLADVRGKGLLMGMQCKVPNTDVVNKMRDHKLLVVGGGSNVIRILPPLVISDDEIAMVKERMMSALGELQAEKDK
jgi:acetylornithine/N-succinyldiaminopimelate aminotransferase